MLVHLGVSIERGGLCRHMCSSIFFQAEDGIRDLVRSRGLGDVYKRQAGLREMARVTRPGGRLVVCEFSTPAWAPFGTVYICLLYTSDAADERSSVDLGGRRIIKKKTYLYETIRNTLLRPATTMHVLHIRLLTEHAIEYAV